jgi:hypothetical protein
MTTITFGFFAVLIGRELPGRRRVWPYLLAGVVVTLVAFARLFLGAHWASDLVGGSLFGLLWLLVLGLAYRRHLARSFWMRPLAWSFYSVFALAALWHAPRASEHLLAKFAISAPTRTLAAGAWWQHDWTSLPDRRAEADVRRRWPLDVQVAGPLTPVQAALEAQGWRAQPQADWTATVGLLDEDTPLREQVVLPATLDAQAESLLMLHDGEHPGELHALRLWPAPATLDDGTPLWLGSTQTLRASRLFGVVSLWQPEPDTGHTHAFVAAALAAFGGIESPHPGSGRPVLRLRSGEAGGAGTPR